MRCFNIHETIAPATDAACDKTGRANNFKAQTLRGSTREGISTYSNVLQVGPYERMER